MQICIMIANSDDNFNVAIVLINASLYYSQHTYVTVLLKAPTGNQNFMVYKTSKGHKVLH